MTELLEEALSKIRALPAEAQDHLAHLLLDCMAQDEAPIPLTADEAADIAAAEAEIERGEFALDEDLRRMWLKYSG